MKESNLHNSRAFGSINKFNSSLSSVNSTSKEWNSALKFRNYFTKDDKQRISMSSFMTNEISEKLKNHESVK